MVALTVLSISGIYFSIVFPGKFFLSKCSFCIFLVCFSFAGDDVTKSDEGHACSEPLPFWNKREIVICETGTSSIFSFSDPIIPLVVWLEIACWIGPDRKNLRSGPIRCFFCRVEISLCTVPDEFGTGLKFIGFGLPFTLKQRNQTNLRPPWQDEFASKQARKDEFQPSPKFIQYRVNGV